MILKRRAGERIVLDKEIEIVVLEIRSSHIQVGVLAPVTVQILRGELNEFDNPSQKLGSRKSLQNILLRRKIVTRLNQVSPNESAGQVKDMFEEIHRKLGMVPNMMRAMANAPQVLQSYLDFSGALSSGILTFKDRERIALTVAEANGCEYCLAAHSALGKMAGLAPEEILASRRASAVDSRTAALLQFARAVVDTRGRIADSELIKARAQGLTDGELAEVIANVALNVFTNYLNNVAQTDIDFPIAKSLSA